LIARKDHIIILSIGFSVHIENASPEAIEGLNAYNAVEDDN